MFLLLLASPLAAQVADTAGPRPQAPGTRPLKPLHAFFYSLVLPGLAQAKLDRKLTAALFVTWEGVTAGMALKADRELRYLRRSYADSTERIGDKKRERQDWLVLLAFNHLFAGLEAYVGSQLQDFPADVRFRALPGGVGLSGSVAFRIR